MFGPKLTTVFKSPKHALIWAGFVLATAYCSVPSEDDIHQADAIAAAASGAQGGQHRVAHHANPWARDSR